MGGNSCTSTFKTMWPLSSGAGSDGTYMHSTRLSQLTLHASLLTFIVDKHRVLKWMTTEAWFRFPP